MCGEKCASDKISRITGLGTLVIHGGNSDWLFAGGRLGLGGAGLIG